MHGADVALQNAALVSAMEEVLHTDVSTRLAHRAGRSHPAGGHLPGPAQHLDPFLLRPRAIVVGRHPEHRGVRCRLVGDFGGKRTPVAHHGDEVRFGLLKTTFQWH